MSIHQDILAHGIGGRFRACLLGDSLDLPPRTGDRLAGTPRSFIGSVRIRLLLPGDLHNNHNIGVGANLKLQNFPLEVQQAGDPNIGGSTGISKQLSI